MALAAGARSHALKKQGSTIFMISTRLRCP
jgi:hypothetical protein